MPRRVLLVLSLLVLATAVPAAAQDPERDAVVVVSAPGAELRAYEDGEGGFCVALRTPGEDYGGSAACGPTPRFKAYGGARIVDTELEDGPAVGGAVPPEVARVEVVPARGAPVVVDTVAGEAYRGRRAGKVRFFLAALSAAFEPYDARLLAADGTLLAVEDLADDARPPVVGPLRVGTIRDGGRRLRVQAEVVDELEPNLIDPGHRERFGCLVVRARGQRVRDGDATARTCLFPLLGAVLSPDVRVSCGPARTYVSAFFEGGERSATVVLGSGRRLRARTFSLPSAVGAGRAWVAVVPGGEAVRRVERPGGEPLVLERAPAALECAADEGVLTGYGLSVSLGSGDPFGPRVVPPVPPAVAAGQRAGTLLAADAPNGSLCLTFGRTALRGSDCGSVVRGDDGRTIAAVAGPGQRAVGGVTARAAVSAEIAFADGTTATAAVGDPPPGGYAGGYRGKVRFYAVVARTTARPVRVTLRSAAGRVLAAEQLGSPFGSVSAVRTLAGTPRLFAGRVPFELTGSPRRRVACVALRRPRRADDCLLLDPQDDEFSVRVGCGPRATTIIGRVRERTVAVEVELADGHRRRVPIRAGRVVGARLPRGEGLRAVLLRTRGSIARLRYDLPPASAQCGYAASPFPIR